MILLIDNYDSFTYNLYQMAGEFVPDIITCKNDDRAGIEMALKNNPSHIIISPGPGKPRDAGLCGKIIREQHDKRPLLGICLGHQAICETFGATVTYAKKLMHGQASTVHIANGNPIFRGLAPVIDAGRYHSLSVKRDTLPDELLVIAEDDDGEVMGIKHKDHDLYGLQFHPESILTRCGKTIIGNFLKTGGDTL